MSNSYIFKLEAVISMLPKNENNFLSSCEVEELDYEDLNPEVESNIDEEIGELSSWAYPQGFIELLYCSGFTEGRFKLKCIVEIGYYSDYWGEWDSNVNYEEVEVTKLT